MNNIFRTRHRITLDGIYGNYTGWRCSCGVRGRAYGGAYEAKRRGEEHVRKYRA
ncbi:hypothetical protein [Streptomyces ficellus]|uniref:hypothetical protein n=1 Tax=Streptomyces ficellus TaxID=1977088 RepID=UPI0012E8105F|nr:hypothetical protein [Streptomyces ficellus]